MQPSPERTHCWLRMTIALKSHSGSCKARLRAKRSNLTRSLRWLTPAWLSTTTGLRSPRKVTSTCSRLQLSTPTIRWYWAIPAAKPSCAAISTRPFRFGDGSLRKTRCLQTNRGNLAAMLLANGQLEEALDENRRVLELHPDAGPEEHLDAVKILVLLGRYDKAQSVVDQLPNGKHRDYGLALLHGLPGRRAEADAALKRLEAKDDDFRTRVTVADIYAFRGMRDEALSWLIETQKALEACQGNAALFAMVLSGRLAPFALPEAVARRPALGRADGNAWLNHGPPPSTALRRSRILVRGVFDRSIPDASNRPAQPALARRARHPCTVCTDASLRRRAAGAAAHRPRARRVAEPRAAPMSAY